MKLPDFHFEISLLYLHKLQSGLARVFSVSRRSMLQQKESIPVLSHTFVQFIRCIRYPQLAFSKTVNQKQKLNCCLLFEYNLSFLNSKYLQKGCEILSQFLSFSSLPFGSSQQKKKYCNYRCSKKLSTTLFQVTVIYQHLIFPAL